MQNGFRQRSLFCCTNLQRTKHFSNLPPCIKGSFWLQFPLQKLGKTTKQHRRSNDTTYVQTVHTPAGKGEDTVTTMQHKNSRIGTEFLSLSALFLCPLRIAFSSPSCPLFHYLRRYRHHLPPPYSCLNNRDSLGFHMKRKEKGTTPQATTAPSFPSEKRSKKCPISSSSLIYNRNTSSFLTSSGDCGA